VTRRVVDFALLFEKAAREIDVACALKAILERRHGLTTEIIQQNHPEPWVLRDLRPAVVVLPFCYQERSNNAFLMRWREAVFFNLTWEQLFYPGNQNAKTPRGEFAVRHVIHNAWSKGYADMLRRIGVPEEHIFLSGNPAYTLLAEPYRRYFKDRRTLASEHGLDVERRWVFFPENYNWAFYEQAMLEQMIRDGQPVEQVSGMRDQVTSSFEQTMRWCARLAELDKVELVIRPRPATPVHTFRRRVGEVLGRIPAGMTIVADDTVRDWILASDLVVSSYSTSLIEASLAGKPAYIVEPIEWPWSLHQEWHDLAPRLTSMTDFVTVASGPGDAALSAPLADWARRELMSHGDSILRIADGLARVRRGDVPVPAPASWESLTLPSRHKLPSRLVYELRRHVRPRLPAAARGPIEEELRRDVATVSEVPERVRRWTVVLDTYLATIDPVTR
jgi:surface carbohydrate biosynthesis protein